MLSKKPAVIRKIIAYRKKCADANRNIAVRGFQLSYKSICNFRCSHCYVKSSAKGKQDSLTLADATKIADQFDSLNAWELGIQGGEPLMFPDLFELIEAVRPERFYLCLITNGFLLTDAIAEKLASLGVDRVAVSIDGFNAEDHDSLRNKPGSFERCLTALEKVKKYGMTPTINMVVGNYNARSSDFEGFVKFAAEKRYQIVLNPATPTGAWHGKYEMMLNGDDSRHLIALQRKYKILMRDTWDFFEQEDAKIWGDPAGNLYFISSSGSIFPHPYIFINLGNIHTTPIKDAISKAWRVKYFRDRSEISLAGENQQFVENFLAKATSIHDFAEFDEVFSTDDLYETGEEEIIAASMTPPPRR